MGILIILLGVSIRLIMVYRSENATNQQQISQLQQTVVQLQNQQIADTQTFFANSTYESNIYQNKPHDFKLVYPKTVNFDEDQFVFSGGPLADKMITIEFTELSTPSPTQATTEDEVVVSLGRMKLNDQYTSVFLGAQREQSGRFTHQYLAYEIVGDKKVAYIKLFFGDSLPNLTQIDILTTITHTFQFQPDLEEHITAK